MKYADEFRDKTIALGLAGAIGTVREVHEALGKDSGYTTTLKQMQVMHEKGLLVRSERFRAHVYEPGVPQGQTRKQLAQTLLARAFDGSARELLQSALTGRRVSSAEIAAIRGLLDEIHIDLAAVLLGAGVRLFGHLAAGPVVLGDPTVVAGAGVTHLRYPVRRA